MENYGSGSGGFPDVDCGGVSTMWVSINGGGRGEGRKCIGLLTARRSVGKARPLMGAIWPSMPKRFFMRDHRGPAQTTGAGWRVWKKKLWE